VRVFSVIRRGKNQNLNILVTFWRKKRRKIEEKKKTRLDSLSVSLVAPIKVML